MKELSGDYWGRDSLSGNERNRLFISNEGKQFIDVTNVSGADHIGDGRSVVLWDYNHDGLTDIASVNTNAPKLVFYRNETDKITAQKNNFLALRLIGGNRADSKSGRYSNRDGYGAKIRIKCDGSSFYEEHRCGEGFSAQNSNTIIIGVGKEPMVRSVTISWPSGNLTELPGLRPGILVTVYENSEDSPNRKAFTVESYVQ